MLDGQPLRHMNFAPPPKYFSWGPPGAVPPRLSPRKSIPLPTAWFTAPGNPGNLNPMLPAYPWSQRPDDHPLTPEEVCGALVESEGDVRLAAERLKVGSLILRKFIERSSRARAVIVEMNARLADEAQTTLHQALRDSDARRADWATRYILNSKNARALGWASSDPADDAAAVRGPLINLTLPVVQWQDGTLIGPREAARAIVDLTPSPTPSASVPVKTGTDD